VRHVFVSGHVDLTNDEFVEHYAPRLTAAWTENPGRTVFHVGDCAGADFMAQEFIDGLRAPLIVYHMLERPRNLFRKSTPLVGGFRSDRERDEAMTAATSEDIAWVRPGRERSGTAKNLARRK
jgi:hypothetical protein